MKVYVGAYVEAPEIEREEQGCPTLYCSADRSHEAPTIWTAPAKLGFCRDCGEPMKLNQPVSLKRSFLRPDDYGPEVSAIFEDYMADLQGHHRNSGKWVPNKIAVPHCFYGRVGEDGAELTAYAIQKSKAALAELYAEFLKYMEERHDVKLVVKYGILPA